MELNCICPECKNEILMDRYSNAKAGMVIECETCGISLLIKSIDVDRVVCEVVDEGK